MPEVLKGSGARFRNFSRRSVSTWENAEDSNLRYATSGWQDTILRPKAFRSAIANLGKQVAVELSGT